MEFLDEVNKPSTAQGSLYGMSYVLGPVVWSWEQNKKRNQRTKHRCVQATPHFHGNSLENQACDMTQFNFRRKNDGTKILSRIIPTSFPYKK